MLIVDRLTKTYGDVTAVDDVSFHADKGMVFGLLGPNGAGKTTALKVLAGLLLPDGGCARIAGNDVVADRQLTTPMSTVFVRIIALLAVCFTMSVLPAHATAVPLWLPWACGCP